MPVSLASVSERTGISRGYLEQLALALRNARLVRGIAGRYGGYRLSASPGDITVGQIVEAAIGPICLVDCVEDPLTCPRAEFCECRIIYSIINDRVSEVLNEYTLADLLNPSWVRDHIDLVNMQNKGPDSSGGAGEAKETTQHRSRSGRAAHRK